MALKPVSLEQMQRGKLMLVYGAPGTGKSTFAARFASARSVKERAVILDMEVGIREAIMQVSIAARGFEPVLFDLSNPTPTMTADLVQLLRKIQEMDDVTLVVLDTLSELTWSLLQGLCGMKEPTLKIYGERKKNLRLILMELRNLTKSGKDVLVLTHETVGEVEGLPGYYAPACPERDRADIVGIFDIVGRIQVASKANAAALSLSPGERFINLIQDTQYVSKCRYPLFASGEQHILNVHTREQVIKLADKLQ